MMELPENCATPLRGDAGHGAVARRSRPAAFEVVYPSTASLL